MERAEEVGHVQLQEAGEGGQALHPAGRTEETGTGTVPTFFSCTDKYCTVPTLLFLYRQIFYNRPQSEFFK
jgi:hypothetical protein